MRPYPTPFSVPSTTSLSANRSKRQHPSRPLRRPQQHNLVILLKQRKQTLPLNRSPLSGETLNQRDRSSPLSPLRQDRITRKQQKEIPALSPLQLDKITRNQTNESPALSPLLQRNRLPSRGTILNQRHKSLHQSPQLQRNSRLSRATTLSQQAQNQPPNRPPFIATMPNQRHQNQPLGLPLQRIRAP